MESLIASVVLAIAAMGIAGSVSSSAQQTGDIAAAATMHTLARALMEEISAVSFIGPASGDQGGWAKGNADRSTYDSLDDFDGYTDTSPFSMRDGTPFSLDDGRKYTRKVEVQFRTTPNGAAAGSGDFAMIRVHVSADAVGTITLEKLLTNFTEAR